MSDKNIINFFNDKDNLHNIIQLSDLDDIKTLENVLKVLETILIVGDHETARLSLTANPLALKISQDSSFKNIENLQTNKNEKIADFAHSLFENYFENL